MMKCIINNCLQVITPRVKLGAVVFSAIFFTACSDSSGTMTLSPTGPDTQSLELSAPRFLRERIDPDDLVARVTINGRRIDVEQVSGFLTFRGEAQIPEGDDVKVVVEWREFFDSPTSAGGELLLAVWEDEFPAIDNDREVRLIEDDYETQDFDTYPLLDIDNDRVPNFSERVEISDPFDSFDPVARANAFIPFLDTSNPATPLIIDGSFDDIWLQAQYQDRNDDELFIDNRMIGFDPDRPDQSTEFRWGALHDGNFLYLLVLGEKEELRTTQSDSVEPWFDDAIDIFWDGNRSQGSSYDQVDDYHLIIPLTQFGNTADNDSHLADGTLNPNGRGETGTNSVGIDDYEGVRFATCVQCDPQVYEVRLDLNVLGIPLDESFGFDVQINNDVDGGARDFKFGWQALSADDAGLIERDRTWEVPSEMGLLELISAENSTAAFAL